MGLDGGRGRHLSQRGNSGVGHPTLPRFLPHVGSGDQSRYLSSSSPRYCPAPSAAPANFPGNATRGGGPATLLQNLFRL